MDWRGTRAVIDTDTPVLSGSAQVLLEPFMPMPSGRVLAALRMVFFLDLELRKVYNQARIIFNFLSEKE